MRRRKLFTKGRRLWRICTSVARLKPSFFIVGAQKAGTSSLYYYLTQHPEIAPAEQKELHYFDIQYHRSRLWYRSKFPLARHGAITGEATPYYLFHPEALERIATNYPSAKLLILLRNPKDRAISHYYHAKKMGVETLSLEDALRAESRRLTNTSVNSDNWGCHESYNHQHYSYIARGLYVDQIRRCFRYFSREQVWIRFSEEFFRDPSGTVRDAYDFLGVGKAEVKLNLEPQLVGAYNSKLPVELLDRLDDYYRPHNSELFELLGQDYDW